MLALAYQLRQNSNFPYFPGVGGWVVKLKLKLNSAQLKLELGLSLAKTIMNVIPTDPKFLYLPGLEMGGRWKLKIKLKSAKLELELGLSMEKVECNLDYFFIRMYYNFRHVCLQSSFKFPYKCNMVQSYYFG